MRIYLPLFMASICGTTLALPLAAEPAAKPRSSAKKSASKPAIIIGDRVITQEEILNKLAASVPGVANLRTQNPKAFENIVSQFMINYWLQELLTILSKDAEAKLLKDKTVQDALEKAKRDILVTAFLKDYMETNTTDKLLQDLYKKNPQEMVTFFDITFRAESDAKAFIKVWKGGQKNFEDILKDILESDKKISSKDASRKKILSNGKASPVILSTLSANIQKDVIALDTGGVLSQPIATRLSNGSTVWRVVKLLKKESASFKQAQPVLKRLASIELFRKLISGATKTHKVQIFDMSGKSITEKIMAQAT